MSTGAIINEALVDANEEAEALALARMEEWSTDLHLFSLECLGNNIDTDPKLAFNHEPRVRAYTNWVGDQILRWLADRKAGKVKSRRKIMLLVPRECGKTTNITAAVPVWLQIHDPNIAVTIDMARYRGMTDKTMAVIKEHMLGSRPSAKLIETFGTFYDPRRTWNESMVVSAKRTDMVRRDKTIEGTSVDIGSTGSHPDVWIWDDPVIRELYGETWCNSCFDHYLSTIPILRSDGLFILVATRYGDIDPTGRIIDEEIAPAVIAKYGELPQDFRRNWAKYAPLAGWEVWLDHGRNPDDPDELWYPSIWTRERIEEYERVSPAEFAAQVMNMPGVRADQPLQRDHVDRLWVDYENVPDDVWLNIYIHMDLAWKNSKNYKEGKGDYSVIQVWGRDNAGFCYYLPLAYRGRDMQEGFRRHYIEILQQLMRKRAHIRLQTYDEPQSGMGDSVLQWFRDVCLQAGVPCPPTLEMNRRGQDNKDDRCMLASRYWIDGTVKLVRHAPHVQFLVEEMLGIGQTRYDDMRDAAADQFHSDVWRAGGPRRSPGYVAGGRRALAPWESYFQSGFETPTMTFVRENVTPLELEMNRRFQR